MLTGKHTAAQPGGLQTHCPQRQLLKGPLALALRAPAGRFPIVLPVGQCPLSRGWPVAATPPALDVQTLESSEAAVKDVASDMHDTDVVEAVVLGNCDSEDDSVVRGEVEEEEEKGDVAAFLGASLSGAKPARQNDDPATVAPLPLPTIGGTATSSAIRMAEQVTAVISATPDGVVAATSPLPLRQAPEVELPLAALVGRRMTDPSRSPRPFFPPPLDLQRLSDTVLGEPTIGPIFNELFELSRARQAAAGASANPAAAGPLLYRPRFPRSPGSPPASSLPLLVYLPGIDGTGLAAYRQFPLLSACFDLRGVFLPPEDRTPFHGLVESLAQQLEDEVAPLDPSRPVYLLGESFGGLIALELAQRVSCVDRLILVNPATSFDRSLWPSLGPLLPALPPELYRLLPLALSPILSNPLSMAAWNTSNTDPLPQQAVDLLSGLLYLLPELSSLQVVLPPETLSWRLQLLREGAEAVNASLGKVRQRTLLLVGESDLVIPSASEAPRLETVMPRCQAKVVRGGSHALLQEATVDLVRLLQEEDFYVSRRNLTSPNTPAAAAGASASRRKPAPSGAGFGTPAPVELPTPGELHRAADARGLTALRRLVSPIFLSTDEASGRVQLGLEALPRPGSGPVLFVGNHQLLASDMPLMVEEFIKARGQLLRGLAHPVALGMTKTDASPGRSTSGPDPRVTASEGSRFGHYLETFGAVPVSGRNLYQLLRQGEAVLLYPGGVREALKLRNEQYKLVWPRRAEFVRMACRLGATLVPFAAVGAEDSVELLLDRKDLMAVPGLGDWLRQQQKGMVMARRGVTVSEDVDESFVFPLVAPKSPARFYYLFGAPIRTDPRFAEDRDAVSQLYGQVQSEVERCLEYLIRKRDQDPYKDLLPRLLYEASWGGRRQAPTFTL
ncbi:hypothetical protein Vretimale_4099 [Volvox reticuliferus]|uniref:Serine aminopeptidase S33 domain-containing protein n=1 Tax=Volvox reticuliferus TaxID=1737510 RepID=A0A8J4DB99_9CHLO|nr:hypothetical protein Vretifemale_1665 [Volvox reticuliferus]GIL98727.1 hypothetical protein Vretimale_4099 [Volvox reticuliferus]